MPLSLQEDLLFLRLSGLRPESCRSNKCQSHGKGNGEIQQTAQINNQGQPTPIHTQTTGGQRPNTTNDNLRKAKYKPKDHPGKGKVQAAMIGHAKAKAPHRPKPMTTQVQPKLSTAYGMLKLPAELFIGSTCYWSYCTSFIVGSKPSASTSHRVSPPRVTATVL